MQMGESFSIFAFTASVVATILLLVAIHNVRGEGRGIGKLPTILLSFFSGVLLEGFFLFAESHSKLMKLMWLEAISGKDSRMCH